MQTADKFVVRLPDGLRDEIKVSALENNRSMNAEIVARLTGGVDPDALLRDKFAMAALAALTGMASISLEDGDMIMGWGDMAKSAYKAADAMIAARKAGA